MIDFVGPSYQLNFKLQDVQRSINLMPTPTEAGSGKAPMFLQPVPGMSVFSDSADVEPPVDGLTWRMEAVPLSGLLYSEFYSNFSEYVDGKLVSIGEALEPAGPVGSIFNASTGVQIAEVTALMDVDYSTSPPEIDYTTSQNDNWMSCTAQGKVLYNAYNPDFDRAVLVVDPASLSVTKNVTSVIPIPPALSSYSVALGDGLQGLIFASWSENTFSGNLYAGDYNTPFVLHKMTLTGSTIAVVDQIYGIGPSVDYSSPLAGVADYVSDSRETLPDPDRPRPFVQFLDGSLIFTSASTAYYLFCDRVLIPDGQSLQAAVFKVDLTAKTVQYQFTLYTQELPVFYFGGPQNGRCIAYREADNSLWFATGSMVGGTEPTATPPAIPFAPLDPGGLYRWVIGSDPASVEFFPFEFLDQTAHVTPVLQEFVLTVLSGDGVWVGFQRLPELKSQEATANISYGTANLVDRHFAETATELRYFSFESKSYTDTVLESREPSLPAYKVAPFKQARMVDATTGVINFPSVQDSSNANSLALLPYPGPQSIMRFSKIGSERLSAEGRYIRLTIRSTVKQSRVTAEASQIGIQRVAYVPTSGGAAVAFTGATCTNSHASFPVANIITADVLDPDESWRSDTATVPTSIVLDAGGVVDFEELRIWPVNESGSTSLGLYLAPHDFDIEVSADGEAWTLTRVYRGVTIWPVGYPSSANPAYFRRFQVY